MGKIMVVVAINQILEEEFGTTQAAKYDVTEKPMAKEQSHRQEGQGSQESHGGKRSVWG